MRDKVRREEVEVTEKDGRPTPVKGILGRLSAESRRFNRRRQH